MELVQISCDRLSRAADTADQFDPPMVQVSSNWHNTGTALFLLTGVIAMITVLNEQRECRVAQANAIDDALWLQRADVEATTGWSWKPEGLCQADTCVPLPRGAAGEKMVRGDTIDIAAVWQHMGHPVAHDAAGSTWVLGTGAAQRAGTMASLNAPDFELPDLNGTMRRLSDYRGKKVFLATWASW
jgi:AhpC/TSA family